MWCHRNACQMEKCTESFSDVGFGDLVSFNLHKHKSWTWSVWNIISTYLTHSWSYLTVIQRMFLKTHTVLQNILENSSQEILKEHIFRVPSLNQALSLLSQLKAILLVLLTWKIKRKLLFSYLQFHLMFLKATILIPWSVLTSREAFLVLQCFLIRCVFITISELFSEPFSPWGLHFSFNRLV